VKRTAKRVLVATWLVLATFLLAQLWLIRPDLGPQVPKTFSLWLVNTYNSANGEQLRDLEVLIALVCAFAAVSIVTFGALLLRGYIHPRDNPH
jgi:peptidoglycan/LPS O-acetylase OafA/YrhL